VSETITAAEVPTHADRPPIDLRPLFSPRSIAVVGASSRGGIARTVRDNLRVMDSATRCHFINPRYDELDGQRCYPSIEALPERPDIVLVAVNPLRAAAIVDDAGRAGVPAVIVPGGGVVEGGEAAAQMQRDVREIALRHGIALLGPNCMGIVDLTTNAATYIGDVNPWLPRGGVMGIAQSGSVTDAFLHSGNRIGFSRIVGCGSEVVLDTCDFLAYALDDPETEAVILFLEGFRRPERFLALADRALQIGKPIMVVKVGRSTQAQAAAIAHSGSMAGEDRATDAALAAVGVIRCGDLDELIEAAELVAGCRRTGRRVGRGRVGVVTVSTGEASLIADLAPRTGVDLPAVPEPARAALLRDLPTLGYIGNPLDPWGATEPASAYTSAFEAFAGSGAYDVLALVHDFPYRSLPGEVETALTVMEPLLAATETRPEILPVVVSLTSGEPTAEVLERARAGGGVPVLRGAVEAFTAIAAVGRWERRHDQRRAGEPLRPTWPDLAADRTLYGHYATAQPSLGAATGKGGPAATALPELESLDRLAAAGIPVVRLERSATADQAAAAADAIGYPVVLKVDVVGLAHKTDIGAVRLDLRDPTELREAAQDLLTLPLPDGAIRRGLLVMPQLGGRELIVGARRDPSFGPLVLVGLGGILAEAIDDVAVSLAPVSPTEAEAMLDGFRARRLLGPLRGQPGIDRASVVDAIVRLSDLIVANPDIIEVDINPLISGPGGTAAADALIVVGTS
jgi:acyl-CoA synthetase (NDP forming)